jgi:hypothetical protein
VGGPDGVQEEHRWFILVRAEKCPMFSGERSSVLSCTEVLVVGITSSCERGRISQVSWCEWRMWVSATLLEPSQGPGELSALVLVFVMLWAFFFPLLE